MANLPAGNFLTTVSGKQCTAVPRSIGGGEAAASSAAATTTSSTAAETTVENTPPPAAQTTTSQQPPIPPVAVPSRPPERQPPPPPPPPPPAQSSPPSGPPLPPPPPPPPSVKSSSSSISVAPTTSTTSIASSTQTPSVESNASVTSTSSPAIAPEATPSTTQPISPSSVVPSSNLTPPPVIVSDSTASKSADPTPTFETPLAQLESGRSTLTPSPTTFSTESASNPVSTSSELSIPTFPANAAAGSDAPSTDGDTSKPRTSAAPIVGGLLGAMGFIALLAVLFFFLKRRKSRRRSNLMQYDSGTRTDFYGDEKSAEARQYDEKWAPVMAIQNGANRLKMSAATLTSKIAGIGGSLKAKVIGSRSASPSVNLNRGNSQFLDGPILQHSRNNSALSGGTTKLTVKERIADLGTRLREDFVKKVGIGRKGEPEGHFAVVRSNKKQTQLGSTPPDFSQLLGMDDRELQLESERQRANFDKRQSGSSLPPLGSLGLSFSTMKDPFADPVKPPNSKSDPFTDPIIQPKYPFGEPVSTPRPSKPKQNTYIADVRRSRGRSLDASQDLLDTNNRPLSTTGGEPISRYPSSIAPSRDSYRDTVYSSFSANARKGKGRSDPFDLERPELWQAPSPSASNPRASGRVRGSSISIAAGSNSRLPPLTTNNLRGRDPSAYSQQRAISQSSPLVSAAGTYESKYSSGVSSLDAWGDPGPDLGPGSTNTSMRGNASNGGSQDFGHMSVGDGEVSPLSVDSGRFGGNRVGTAM